MTRPPWDFEYRLVRPGYARPAPARELVVALRSALPKALLEAALASMGEVRVEALMLHAPIFWYRVLTASALEFEEVSAALLRAGLGVRYVTSALEGNLSLGERLVFDGTEAVVPSDWTARPARPHSEPKTAGRWVFHEAGGIDVDRAVCGTGAGARLAVIDDEAKDSHALPLDREVTVGTTTPSRAAIHGSMMVAWSVGSNGDEARDVPAFTGIAPDASPRLYVIPKAGGEVVNFPCAVVRAVADGADVVVCATPLEGVTSPLLDDAFEFAHRLGRGGLGTAVVVPTGREISSAPGSLHASLTLALGDPASDPRVLCVAPSGRDGGWFTWADKRGVLRPFANRGPAVRVAAPGDDMSHPFLRGERYSHAESSVASAIVAGVAALVVATNPTLTAGELYDVLSLTSTCSDVKPRGTLADPADLQPDGRDADGHEAKCGYGRVSAARACLAVADPVTAALTEMGDAESARTYLAVSERRDHAAPTKYSKDFARWAALALRREPLLGHAVKTILRHLRLVATDATARRAQPVAAFARYAAYAAEQLASLDVPATVRDEVIALRDLAIRATRDEAAANELETTCFSVAAQFWDPQAGHLDATPVGGVVRSA